MVKWSLVLICALTLVSAQNGYYRDRPDNQFGYDNSAQDYQDEEGNGGGEIPGEAGRDYPVYSEVPETSFSCSNQQYPGYYADPEAQCQVFYICQRGGKSDAFLCPNGTVFNQEYLVCDWWYNFDCSRAESLYSVNEQVLRAMEEADTRLGQQGQGGYDSSLSPDIAYGVPQRNGNGNGQYRNGNGNGYHGNGNGNNNGNGNSLHGNGNGNGNGHHGNGNGNGNGHHGNGNGNGNGHHGNGIGNGNGRGKSNGNGKYHGNGQNGQNGISSQYGAPVNFASNRASTFGPTSFNGGSTEADFSHGFGNGFGHTNGNGHEGNNGNGYANGNGLSHNGNGNGYSQNRKGQNGHKNGNGHNGNGNGNDHHDNNGHGFRGNGNGFSNGNGNHLSAFRNGLGNEIGSQYGVPNQGNNGPFNGSPFSGSGPERSYLPPSKK